MDIKERISKLVDNALADDCCFNCSDCKQYHNSCVDCTTDKILALFEPVTLEPLKCKESTNRGLGCGADCEAVCHYGDGFEKGSQATIAKNSGTQLYRVRE